MKFGKFVKFAKFDEVGATNCCVAQSVRAVGGGRIFQLRPRNGLCRTGFSCAAGSARVRRCRNENP